MRRLSCFFSLNKRSKSKRLKDCEDDNSNRLELSSIGDLEFGHVDNFSGKLQLLHGVSVHCVESEVTNCAKRNSGSINLFEIKNHVEDKEGSVTDLTVIDVVLCSDSECGKPSLGLSGGHDVNNFEKEKSASTPDNPLSEATLDEVIISHGVVYNDHISDPGVYSNDASLSSHTSCNNSADWAPETIENPVYEQLYDNDSGNTTSNRASLSVEPVNIGGEEAVQYEKSHSSLHSDLVMPKLEAQSRVLSPLGGQKSQWKVSLRNGEGEHNNPSILGYTSDICDEARTHDDSLSTEGYHASSERGFPKAILPCEEEDKCLDTTVSAVLETLVVAPQADSSNELLAHNTSGQSKLKRVEEWVNSIESVLPSEDECMEADTIDGEIEAINVTVETRKEIVGRQVLMTGDTSADIHYANMAIQSLNILSTVGHFSGMGLKVIAPMSMFGNLKSLNLSSNAIERITPGCLPKNISHLDLSRNKISVVEGLRDLTRLRVLNLSHNRISRIGHGLGNCTLIKELYLAGNKISEVEGFHRLLKLAVLDMSFNKLTTPKSIGQMAANYSSLQALNLMGNSMQANFGEDQIRKLVLSLLPHLIYLNRQPIKSVSTRESVIDSVARAALGTSHRSVRSKRSSKRASESQQKGKPIHSGKAPEKRHVTSERSRHHLSSSSQQLEKHHSKRPSGLPTNASYRQPLKGPLVDIRAQATQGMIRCRSEGSIAKNWNQE